MNTLLVMLWALILQYDNGAATLIFGFADEAECRAKIVEMLQDPKNIAAAKCEDLSGDQSPVKRAPTRPEQRLQTPPGLRRVQSEHMVPGQELTIHERVEACRTVAADAMSIAMYRTAHPDEPKEKLKGYIRSDADPGDIEQTRRVVDMAYGYSGEPWDFAMVVFRLCLHGEMRPYVTKGANQP